MGKRIRDWIAVGFGWALVLGPPIKWLYLSIDIASNVEWLSQKLTGSPEIIKFIEAHPLPFEIIVMAIGFGLLYLKREAIPLTKAGHEKTQSNLNEQEVVAFFGTREELAKRYPLSEIFISGNEIYAYFLSGEGIFSWHEDYIRLIKRLILPKPDGHYLQTIRTLPGNPYLRAVDQINTTTALAQKWHVPIKWFDDFIGMAFLFCNPERPDGWVHVELHVPFANASERHAYRLEKTGNRRDFDTLYKAFKKMWDESSPPPAIQGDTTSLPPPRGEFIPMKEAAEKLYREARSNRSSLARAAEEMSGSGIGKGSPEDILNYMATHIAGKMAVYGKKAPSTAFGKISDNEVKGSFFDEGATKLKDRFYDKSIYFTDLAVRSDELNELIAEVHFKSGYDATKS